MNAAAALALEYAKSGMTEAVIKKRTAAVKAVVAAKQAAAKAVDVHAAVAAREAARAAVEAADAACLIEAPELQQHADVPVAVHDFNTARDLAVTIAGRGSR